MFNKVSSSFLSAVAVAGAGACGWRSWMRSLSSAAVMVSCCGGRVASVNVGNIWENFDFAHCRAAVDGVAAKFSKGMDGL